MGCAENPETPPENKQTTVSGIIETDTTWTKENSPYSVVGDILVKRGATLTIQPGVEVRFDGFYSLTVQGILIADGMSNVQQLKENPENIAIEQGIKPQILDFKSQKETHKHVNSQAPQQLPLVYSSPDVILFTSNKSAPEMKDWKGVVFDNTNDDNSLLRYVKIQYADTGIYSSSSKPQVLDCTIRKNQNGITLNSLSPIINYCIITDNIHGIVIEYTATVGHTTNIKKNIITSNEIGIITYLPYSLIEQNNIIANLEYALINKHFGEVVYAYYNWWGTTDTKRISEQIYDKDDDAKLGSVLFEPILNSEVIDAGPR
jgi:hypothetical protein